MALVDECNMDVDCSALGPCWDGSSRLDDAICGCPPFIAPECPETTCPDGMPVDDDCGCEEYYFEPLPILAQAHMINPGRNEWYQADSICKPDDETTHTASFMEWWRESTRESE